MKLGRELLVKPGKRVRFADFDADYTMGLESKDAAKETLTKNTSRLAELQYRLFAENKRALLIVIQAMDAGGKDGTIRHVMSGMNPQSCKVMAFKAPSLEELSHDFLWRIHKAMPARGEIGIFNRSHYEDVLIVRVHDIVPKSVWAKRYRQINAFEQILAENNVRMLKFFLLISKGEQKRRLESRLDDSTKNWKAQPEDFAERRYWEAYTKAYEEALSRCSTPWAPWYVIPANKKWFRNLAVSQIIIEALEEMRPKFPKPVLDPAKICVE